MKWMSKIVMILVIASAALAADSQSTSQLQSEAELLDQQMRALLVEREAMLTQMADEIKLAPLSERVARETEYADLQTHYEIQLLELMVNYYEITGNEELLVRASANLDQLLAPQLNGEQDKHIGTER